MERNEAYAIAKGYTFARDDAAHKNAQNNYGDPWMFAEAWAERITTKVLTPTLKDAWEAWQASEGKSIERMRDVTVTVTIVVPVATDNETILDQLYTANATTPGFRYDGWIFNDPEIESEN